MTSIVPFDDISKKLDTIDLSKLKAYTHKLADIEEAINKNLAPSMMRDFIVAQDVASVMLARAVQAEMMAKSAIEIAEAIALLDKSDAFFNARKQKPTSDLRSAFVALDPDVVAAKNVHARATAMVSLLKNKVYEFKSALDSVRQISKDTQMTQWEGMQVVGVDRADWIFKEYPNGVKEKKYRHFCDNCGVDKGYKFMTTIDGIHSSDRHCRKCGFEKTAAKTKGRTPPNKGKPISESTRVKLRNHNLGKSPSNKGVPASEEVKKKISCSVRGIGIDEFDDFGWKKEAVRKQQFDVSLRHECFKLADYTCDLCSARGVELNAHHLYDYANHPHLLNDIDNLVCLCLKCHIRFHVAYGRTDRKKNCVNTKEQYLEFKEKYNDEQVDD